MVTMPPSPSAGAAFQSQNVSDVELLNELGFDWEPFDSGWEKMFSELEHYKLEKGDCNVPVGWKDNPKLGRWVKTQRRRYKSGSLPSVRQDRLDKLKFEWEPRLRRS